MNLIEFIHESNLCQHVNQLRQTLLRYLKLFGIDRFIMAEMIHGPAQQQEARFNLLANYPEQWLNRYFSNHYVEFDPVYKLGLRTRIPFTWAALDQGNLDKKESLVMNEAREFGLRSGISMPVHQPSGQVIGLAFASGESDIQNDKDSISQLYAAGHQLVVIYNDLMHFETLDSPKTYLTVREKDVLCWIAHGKSKAEVADILNVSESCIKRHCENTFRKLETNNLASTIAKAMRLNLIQPF